MKFTEGKQRACISYVERELTSRGVSTDLVQVMAQQLVATSQTIDFDPDESMPPGAIGLMRTRYCWVIRREDLDIVGTLARYAAPAVGGGTAVALSAGASAAAPIAAGVAAAIAFFVNVGLNMQRKGVTLDPLGIRALAILKRNSQGLTIDQLTVHLAAETNQPFTRHEVTGILDTLKAATADASGASVAVAFERNDLWFSAV